MNLQLDNLDSIMVELDGSRNKPMQYHHGKAIIDAMRRVYSYAQTVAASIGATTMTYTELAAAAIAGDLVPGQHLIINDVGSGKAGCQFRTVAKSTTDIESYGNGSYTNNAMSSTLEVAMGYDLASNMITWVYEPGNNNDLRQSIGVNTFEKYKLDALDVPSGLHWFKNNRLTNVTGTWGIRYANLIDVTAEDCSISLSWSSPGIHDVIIEKAHIKAGCNFSMLTNTGTYVFGSAGLLLWGAHFKGICEVDSTVYVAQANIVGKIGIGKTLSTGDLAPGYSASGTYDDNGSTFAMGGDTHPLLNPDGSGVINMTNAEWLGYVYITDVSALAGNAMTIQGIPIDHRVKFILGNGSTGGDLTLTDAADNMRLAQGSATVVLKAGFPDWIEFIAHPYSANVCIEVARAIYTTP